MTKKMLHAVILCGLAGVALLCGGCVAEGEYVAGGPVYSDVGYARPYYGGYGPSYSETVVIERGSRRGYYDDRRPYRTAARYDGRRTGGNYGYGSSRSSQYGRIRQGNPTGRSGQQAQVQRGRQSLPVRTAARPQRPSGSADRAQRQDEQGH